MTTHDIKAKKTSTKHPQAGQVLSGADTIVQVLADEGVDVVFGYSGGAILPTYDAIFRYNETAKSEMRLLVPANEQGAGFMAAGYARATGRAGVFMVTSGPGATNAVTPIRDCMADSIPVVMICGQVPTAAIGTDAFQEAPIFNIMASCAKQVFLVTKPEELEATVRTAFEIATTGRPGPVVIDIPKDVQNWEGKFSGKDVLNIDRYRRQIKTLESNGVSQSHAEKLLRAIQRSKRPLLYVGGGVVASNAMAELTEFAETFNMPVVTTLMGIGSIDTQHELSMGMLGMHGMAYANYAVEDCDLMVAVGARFDDRVAGKPASFAPRAKYIAHFDIDTSEIGKVKPVDWSHVADAKIGLRSLIEHQKNSGIVKKDFASWRKECAKSRTVHKMDYDRASEAIAPQAVLEKINEITNGKAIVSTGVGQHQMFAAQFFDFERPRLWLTSGSMGTMGFGLPAAIGAQVACPDAIVIDVDGDGSIRMNLGELETATNYDIPVKVLLLNNDGDGMVRQWQKLFFNERFSGSDKTLHKKDFIMSAKADGYEFAEQVSDKSKLDDVLTRFVAAKGPAFLEVKTDREAGVYPMVGPGQNYSQMITGDHIVSRAKSEESEETTEVSKADLF